MLKRPLWHGDAACRGMDPALFVPADGDTVSFETRQVCVPCPVRVECIEFGISHSWRTLTGFFGCGEIDARGLVSARNRGNTCSTWTPSCLCGYCVLMETIVTASPGPVLNRNSPGARCGYSSTYARGCRCRPCGFAMTVRDMRGRPLLETTNAEAFGVSVRRVSRGEQWVAA